MSFWPAVSLSTICWESCTAKTSCELINNIERNYKEICKERGIDLTAKQEQEQADIPQEALFLLDDATYSTGTL